MKTQTLRQRIMARNSFLAYQRNAKARIKSTTATFLGLLAAYLLTIYIVLPLWLDAITK